MWKIDSERRVGSERTMDFYYLDDAGQRRPSRQGMGELVSVGGIRVAEETSKDAEQGIEEICATFGFPPRQPFKWSPGTGLWMHDNLTGERRKSFFVEVLAKLQEFNIPAWVIIEDTTYRTATGVDRHDLDLTQMFLERIHIHLCRRGCNGRVVVSQPSGDMRAENEFLAECTDILREGTSFSSFERIDQVYSLNHQFSRFLQAADVVTSCTTSYVAGEQRHSPPVFESVKPLMVRERGRIGGVGLKLHPDARYANLYHWLLGDSVFIKDDSDLDMPLPDYPYADNPSQP